MLVPRVLYNWEKQNCGRTSSMPGRSPNFDFRRFGYGKAVTTSAIRTQSRPCTPFLPILLFRFSRYSSTASKNHIVIDRSHRTTGPWSDLRPDSWSWANCSTSIARYDLQNFRKRNIFGWRPGRVKQRHSTAVYTSNLDFSTIRILQTVLNFKI